MFYDCSSLTNIDLSNFNTNNVTNMSYMFSACWKFTKDNIITCNKKILESLIHMNKEIEKINFINMKKKMRMRKK